MKKILVIDADESSSKTLEERLGSAVSVSTAATAQEGIRLFVAWSPDAVILDLKLPDMNGLDALERIRAIDGDAYIIIITAGQDMAGAVGAIKKGAFDYISKPLGMHDLELSIKKVFQNRKLHRRLTDLLSDGCGGCKAGTIIGKSRVIQEIFKTIGVASQSKVTVLIQGESGTGKELIARAIHYNSMERDRPFIAINCSALVETLLESELFGHEKGAFTGALFRKEGKFESANGGTVFLDEIGEMSQALQVKLLRVLQERNFERVGGSETIKTDVRVIAATNKDLKALTSRGLFRDDLYYRLKVITIDVPPLRDRMEDVPLLVSHLLEKANMELHKNVRKMPERLMDLMMNYQWPGNVRELENVITRGVALAKDDVLTDVYLPGAVHASNHGAEGGDMWKPCTLNGMEKEHIRKTLEFTGWNKSKAAILLGTTLPRIQRKIKKYMLQPV